MRSLSSRDTTHMKFGSFCAVLKLSFTAPRGKTSDDKNDSNTYYKGVPYPFVLVNPMETATTKAGKP